MSALITPLAALIFGAAFVVAGLFSFGKGKPELVGWALILCGVIPALLAPLIIIVEGNSLVGTLVGVFAYGATVAGIAFLKGWDPAPVGSLSIFCGTISFIYFIFFLTLGGFYYIAFSCLLWAIWWWTVTGFTWGKIAPKVFGSFTLVLAFVTFLVIAMAMLLGIPLP